ncbi:MAG: hypothetical protein IJN34_01025 [Clostridia bacterium]|nr:hypothetical protein [Clostridia bacterium]
MKFMPENGKRIAAVVLAVLLIVMIASCKKEESMEFDSIGNETFNQNDLNEFREEMGVESTPEVDEETPSEEKPSEEKTSEEKPSQNPDQSVGNKPSTQSSQKEPVQQTPSEEEPSLPPIEEGDSGSEEYDRLLKELRADQSGTKVKIFCQNVRCDAAADRGTDNDARIRRWRLKKLVEKMDPDIMGLQEVGETWIPFLEEDYPEYELIYHWRWPGKSHESTPVMYKKSKYTEIRRGYFWLSETPNKPSSSYVPDSLARICVWVTLKDKETGVRFNIYSTHFGLGEGAAVVGAGNQMAELFESQKNGTYSIMMGDLNSPYMTKVIYPLWMEYGSWICELRQRI